MEHERIPPVHCMPTADTPCPYLPGMTARFMVARAESFSDAEQESMIVDGWRRSGAVLYMPRCRGCSACVPLRLDTGAVPAGRRRAAAATRNRDVETRLIPAEYSDERRDLYLMYVSERHGSLPGPDDADEFRASFLVHPRLRPSEESPLMMEYRLAGSGRLVALGFLDAFPDGLSSVYFAFDPRESRRSLGVFSVGVEAAAAAALGKRRYYLGFWVPGASTMDYKADFRPFEIPIATEDGNFSWKAFPDRGAALRALAQGDGPPRSGLHSRQARSCPPR